MNKEQETAVGPNGEIRPTDPIANQTVALGVALGTQEEEYVDEEHRQKAEKDRLDRPRVLHEMDEDGNVRVIEVTTRRELEAQLASK